MSDIDDRLDRLESLVEQQQETIKEQRERIADLEGDDSTEERDDTETVPAVSRRGALTAGGLLALLFGGVGTASADAQGQIGTSQDPLNALYTTDLNGPVTGDESLTNIVGTGLTINSGSLEVSGGNTGLWKAGSSGSSYLEPSDSGDTKLEGINTIESNDQDSALTITQDTNDNGGGAKDLTLETIDSGSTNPGNIVLDADPSNNASKAISLRTGGSERARIDSGGVKTDILSDNGSGDVTIGNSLDLDGNDVSISDSFNFHINTGSWPYVAFTDTNSQSEVRIDWDQNLLELHKTDLRIRDGGVVEDDTGATHLTINSGGPLGLNKNLELNGNDITNATGGLTLFSGGGEVEILGGFGLDVQDGVIKNSTGDLRIGSSGSVKVENNTSGGEITLDYDAAGSNSGEKLDILDNGAVKLRVNDQLATGATTGDPDLNETDDGGTTDANGNPKFRAVALDADTGELRRTEEGIYDSATASSRRYKEDITDINGAASRLLDVRPVSFEYSGRDDHQTHFGVIAEELDEVFPELVRYDEEGRPEKVCYEEMAPLLVAHAQHQEETIDDLRAETEELRAENDRLRERNAKLESRLNRIETHLGIDEPERQGVADD